MEYYEKPAEKAKVKENSFPRNLTISDRKITEKSLIAKNLNDFSVNIDRNLRPLF